jgi:hypothetical protein
MRMVSQRLSLLNKDLIPSKDEFLLWMEGKDQIILETAGQILKDFERSGIPFLMKIEETTSPEVLRNSVKKSLAGKDLLGPTIMNLFYLIDIPEVVIKEVIREERGRIEKIAELIMYRSFTKVYFRTVYK